MGHTAKSPALFDHLIGADKERGGNRQAEALRGLRIDDELEFGRLFHRKLVGLRAPEDLVDEGCEPEIEARIVHRVGDQSPSFDELAAGIGGGQPISGSQVDDRLLMQLGEAVCANDKRVDMLLG
jgi:hypothetical protein